MTTPDNTIGLGLGYEVELQDAIDTLEGWEANGDPIWQLWQKGKYDNPTDTETIPTTSEQSKAR